MIYYKFGGLFLLSLIITGCSLYQKYFGTESHNYTNANTTKALKFNKNEFNLIKSDRYIIPQTAGQFTKPITNFAPPDYAKQEVETKVKK